MDAAGSDTSDYETNFSESGKPGTGSKTSEGGYMGSMKQRLQENVTNMMWQSGKERAKSAWNVYGNIDFLRPYFNVEPHEVRTRLLFSLIPQKPTDQRQRIPRELYGPMMVIFTLIALLLFQMKTAEHKVEEGTLMGTAFGVCFTYWLGASGFVWFLAYVCNAHLALIQILSMMGYGLFSHCIVLCLGTIIHTSHDHIFFYILWAAIGGLSALRMVSIVVSRAHGQRQRMIVCGAIAAMHLFQLVSVSIVVSRTHGQRQRMIVCGAIAAMHLLFLLYLHFAYHQIVEDLSQVFESHQPVPAVQPDAGVPQSVDKVVDVVADGAEKLVEKAEPVVDSVVKSVTKALAGTVKQGAPEGGPLLNAIKDVAGDNVKPA